MIRMKILLGLFIFLKISQVFGQSQHAADSLERLVRITSDPDKKVDYLIGLSDLYLKDDVAKAFEAGRQAYQLAEQSGVKHKQITAGLLLAKVYYFTSDLNNAMQYATRAKNLAEASGYERELASSYDAIGTIYYDIGNQNKSSECFSSSLKIFEKLNDQNGIGSSYCKFGTLYLDQKDFDKAAEYYKKSIQIARNIGSREGIASNLNNLAKVYFQQKLYNKALQYYEEAVKINIETGNQYLVGYNYLNIAEVLIGQRRYPEAIDYIYRSRAIFLKLSNKLRVAKSMIMLGRVYMETGNTVKSDSMARASLAIGLENGYKDIIVASAEMLNKSFLSRRDSLHAFKYYILEKQYKDSLFLAEKQKTLARFELQQQFEKNEYNLRIARQRRNVVIIIFSGALLFSVVIIVLILKQLRMRAKQAHMEKASFERELEFKNKELVLNVMSLMKKNEMLTDLSEKLIKIEEESTSDESKNTIKKVAHELQKSQDEEIWKEFSVRFKEVHGDFYNRLLQKFPTLTPNELKLCAFLRLNMSSKDIAELTGQRISTLETARYRLRQKLGIVNSDVNLVAFLSSLEQPEKH